MKRSGLKLGGPIALAMLAVSPCVLSQTSRTSAGYFPGGSISGTIVDAEGIPQMGALVQLLLPDTSLAATALTDARGHYHLSDLKPGDYHVRASAALFLPVVRQKLQLATGSRAVVNLTLSTLLASTQWLPATRRTADSEDDWMWALRSSAMRPVLRAVSQDGNPLSVSTSAAESRGIRSQGRLSVMGSDGGFARGGTHNVLTLERQNGSDSTIMLRGDFSGPRTPYPVAPSTELSVGWQKKLPLGGISRSVLTYTSHPELIDQRGNSGAQTAVFRNAQRMELGDSLRIDAGSVLREFNLGGNAVAMEPFLKVAYRPSSGVVIAYTFTEARGTESIEDLDRVNTTLPVATLRGGHTRLERGRHDALSLSGKSWNNGIVEIAVYRDKLQNPTLAGTGVLSTVDLNGVSTLADPTTQTFAVAGRGYDATGVRVVVRQPITSMVSLGGEFADGRSLVSEAAAHATLADVVDTLAVRNSLSAAVSVDGNFVRSGTKVHGGYRWQPTASLTAVDAFRSSRDTAYLHCKIRQSLGAIPMLPGGLEAVVDVQNLLAQGYRPFLSSDGRTLYLAQSPRVLQAGLSFTF